MRVALLLAGAVLGVAPAFADLVESVASDPRARSVLDVHNIPCGSTGEVAVAIRDAVDLFGRSNLLDVIQSEYTRQLPAGEQCEFVVQATDSNAWHYVNREGQHSEIVELARLSDPAAGAVEVVYFTSGSRFFGRYRALVHIRITEGTEGRSRFASQVWAFPESALPRFFARHLGLVQSFFRDKTRDLTALSVRIVGGIQGPGARPLRSST